MKTFVGVLAIFMLLAPSFVAAVKAQGGQVTLNPTDDTYVDRYGASHSNYGSSEMLKVCLVHYWTLLKFDLSSIPEGALGITAALELYTTYNGVTTTHDVIACLVLNNSWSEATLIGEDIIPDGRELDTEYVANNETWYEWIVTEAVLNATANNATAVTILLRYSYGMDAPSVSFRSKEASLTKKPKLTVSWTGIIPEFPSFLILPLFMIATLLAAIVYRRKHTENPGRATV